MELPVLIKAIAVISMMLNPFANYFPQKTVTMDLTLEELTTLIGRITRYNTTGYTRSSNPTINTLCISMADQYTKNASKIFPEERVKYYQGSKHLCSWVFDDYFATVPSRLKDFNSPELEENKKLREDEEKIRNELMAEIFKTAQEV